jgi:PTH2 family peptidyl-tRNA hydrolase
MYKQVIVVRKDLEMGKGKIATHVAHGSLGSAENVDRKILEKWRDEGAKKIVLKVDNLKELNSLYKKVKAAKLPYCLVRDAGLTQLKTGTTTALGIGPVKEEEVDKITGKLKLL